MDKCVAQLKPSRNVDLEKYHNCVTELRDDLIDCEGPADWFEKRSKTYVCRQFTEIINCNYVRAAMLCGVKPARLLRSFAAEVINKALLVSYGSFVLNSYKIVL
uniref:Uncharacterized protein n=1 Tax=Bactrocera dorsalis TaxID=27457 RepID=A0A034W817_BACDO